MIRGASIFYIDTFIALITYGYDYMHIGLVSEDRFNSLKKIENIEELLDNKNRLEQFTTNQVLDMIIEHKEVEILLGKKYDKFIIFTGTVEELFYNVIDGKGYNEVSESMLKYVDRKYLLNSTGLINNTPNIKLLHEFRDCKLINKVVAKTLSIQEGAIERFVNYMDDLDCICKSTSDGILENIEGNGVSISLNENPFNFVLKNALKNCNLFDMTIDSDTVWENNSICKSQIDTLILKECSVYNESYIFYKCKIKKLLIKRAEVPSYLFRECDIDEIVFSDEAQTIGECSFYECNISLLCTARIHEMKKQSFKKCSINSLITSDSLGILREECLADTKILNTDIIFDSLMYIGKHALHNSSINTEFILTDKLNYLYDTAFTGSSITQIINESSFSLNLEGCKELKKLETKTECKIENLNIEEVVLNYSVINNGTICKCHNLDLVQINCELDLTLDIDFIKDSRLNKLVINAKEIKYVYNDNEVTQDVFVDNIINNTSNGDLEIIINNTKVEYIDDELMEE